MFFPASLIRIWTREEEKVRQHNSWLLDIYISNVYVIPKSKIFQFLLPNVPKKLWFCIVYPTQLLKVLFKFGLKSLSKKKAHFKFFCNLPQNGIPCGTHVPLLLQILRAGPKSSKPRSQEYRATVPGPTDCVLNSTVLWAGAPGNPQPTDGSGKKGTESFRLY